MSPVKDVSPKYGRVIGRHAVDSHACCGSSHEETTSAVLAEAAGADRGEILAQCDHTHLPRLAPSRMSHVLQYRFCTRPGKARPSSPRGWMEVRPPRVPMVAGWCISTEQRRKICIASAPQHQPASRPDPRLKLHMQPGGTLDARPLPANRTRRRIRARQ